MVEIIANDEQARTIIEARGAVCIRDSAGRVLGYVSRDAAADDAGEIEEMKQRLKSEHRRYTTVEVLEHLRSLETA